MAPSFTGCWSVSNDTEWLRHFSAEKPLMKNPFGAVCLLRMLDWRAEGRRPTQSHWLAPARLPKSLLRSSQAPNSQLLGLAKTRMSRKKKLQALGYCCSLLCSPPSMQLGGRFQELLVSLTLMAGLTCHPDQESCFVIATWLQNHRLKTAYSETGQGILAYKNL